MKNQLRKNLIEREYINSIKELNISERNRDIVRKFVKGATYSTIAKEYGVTPGRIRSIVSDYYWKCYRYHKLEVDKTKKQGEINV